MKATAIPFLIIWTVLAGSAAYAATTSHLRCESFDHPSGIDSQQPRLSWIMESDTRGDRQQAYHVLVASTAELLEHNQGDLWDSGTIKSDSSLNVIYAGRPLRSGQHCHWKVKIQGADDDFSPWSEPATWSMGLLDAKDWHGYWIGAEDASPPPARHFFRNGDRKAAEATTSAEAPAVLLRKEATLAQRPTRATAYVSGLGYFEFYINGSRVGDHVMDPVFTDYTHRISYVTYDVTPLLHTGSNALGVILGNGFYHLPTPDLFQLEKAGWHAPPRLLLEVVIEFADGSVQRIVSDRDWKWRTGPIRFNCIRGGETIDWRIDAGLWRQPDFTETAEWRPVIKVTPSDATLAPQLVPPMRATGTFAPISITEPKPGIWLADFGRNLTGWVRYKTQGARGQVVGLDFNEALKADGTLDTEHSAGHTYGRFQHGELILSGGESPDIFEPRFTYHGFRYVQITGSPGSRPTAGDIEAKLVHTDLADAGSFECSNPRLNQLQAAVRRTLLDCVHGMPAEEPTREKMGWTQDAQNTMESYVYNFDAQAIYRNYVRDMIDSQEPNGHVPPIVPTQGWGYVTDQGEIYKYDDPWWGATLAITVDRLYTYYGDRRTLEDAYEPMRRYADWLGTTATDSYFLNWSLGDWLELQYDQTRLTPVPLTSSAGYFHVVNLLARHAAILGKNDDASHYAQLAEKIRAAYNAKFLNATGWYAADSQTAQALPLQIGLVPADRKAQVRANLLADFERRGRHLTTGFIGVMPTLYELSADDSLEQAYTAVTQEEGSGWLYAVKGDSSTLGENLHPRGYGTQHHPFAACIGAWFFNTLAGIQPDPEEPGFKKFVIRPGVVKKLTWVKAHYDSIHGRIAVAWRREPGRFFLDMTVPANTTATLYIPCRAVETVTESDQPATKADGVKFIRMENQKAIFAVSGGTYRFTAPALE